MSWRSIGITTRPIDRILQNSFTGFDWTIQRYSDFAMFTKTGLDNAVLPTLFKVIKNIVQHCLILWPTISMRAV